MSYGNGIHHPRVGFLEFWIGDGCGLWIEHVDVHHRMLGQGTPERVMGGG